MAEYVRQTLEEMIPELEEMSRLELFTTKETKVILKNRESLEYKLRQLTKTKASFLNYIEYEKKVLELLKIRRKKSGNDSKKREIEKSIADRIHQLYRLVTTRFKEDVSLWVQHIDFSKALREKAYVSRLYERVLKIHGHNEALWIQSSRWESSQDGNNNPELAREILLKAHRVNPESEDILLEMFRMELTLAKNILKRKRILGMATEEVAEDDSQAELMLAQIIYRKGIELLPGNSEFHLKLLNVCSNFSDAQSLQDTICDDLRTLYPGTPSVWDALAWIHLTKFRKMGKEERTAAVHRCLEIYEQALKQNSSEAMYSSCLRSHLSLVEMKTLDSNLRQSVLESALRHFDTAIQAHALSEDLCLSFISLLSELALHKEASQVAEWGTNRHPASSKLWLARLTTLTQQGSVEEVQLTKVLDSALASVAETEVWLLWHFALMSLAASSEDASREMLDGLIERVCRWPNRTVSCLAKEWALSWAVRQGGIKTARQVYNKWKITRPISIDFYRIYIQAEHALPKIKEDRMRAAFEESLLEFGRTEPELWLNYVEFERTIAKDGAAAGVVAQRARTDLEPELKELFIRKWIMMTINASAKN